MDTLNNSAPIPDDPSTVDRQLYARAERFFMEDKVQEGTAILLDLAERGSDLWEPYNDLGVLAQAEGELDTAIHFLTLSQIRERQPGVATGNLSKALLLAKKNADLLALWTDLLTRHHADALAVPLTELMAELATQPSLMAALFQALRECWQPDSEEIPPLEDGSTGQGLSSIKADAPGFMMPMRRLSDLDGGIEFFPPEDACNRSAIFHYDVPSQPLAPPFPAVRLHGLDHIKVRPRSDSFLWRNGVFVADHFNPQEHLLHDTHNCYVTPLPSVPLCNVLRDPVRNHIRQGVILTSYAAVNWAHFITEIAPLVAMVEHAGIPPDVPLILSNQLHPNIQELINLIKAPTRPVITIHGKTMVTRAFMFSDITTVPYDYVRARAQQQPNISAADCRFSRAALHLLRTRLGSASGEGKSTASERIFIHRKSSGRHITNAQELADHFRKLGYRIVSPEKMSAREQLAVFSRASIIVGQSGAGLANMVFAPAGCRIVVLTLDTPFNPYGYFTNMANALEHEIHYMGFAPIPDSNPHPAHCDMTVTLPELDAYPELFS